jgi:hypothetical protein
VRVCWWDRLNPFFGTGQRVTVTLPVFRSTWFLRHKG